MFKRAVIYLCTAANVQLQSACTQGELASRPNTCNYREIEDLIHAYSFSNKADKDSKQERVARLTFSLHKLSLSIWLVCIGTYMQ